MTAAEIAAAEGPALDAASTFTAEVAGVAPAEADVFGTTVPVPALVETLALETADDAPPLDAAEITEACADPADPVGMP